MSGAIVEMTGAAPSKEYVETEEEQVSSSTRKMTTTDGQEEQMIMQLESDEEADMAAFWGELFELL